MLEVEGTPKSFTPEQLQKISSKFSVVQSELYGDAVFDVSSRLDYDEWKDSIKEKNVQTLLFDSKVLRHKLIELSGL
jgi:hypothetical protein